MTNQSSRVRRLKVLAVGAAVCLVSCCLGFLSGLQTLADQVVHQLHDHQLIVEQVGVLTDHKVALAASIDIPDPNTFVYELNGSKSDARLIVKSTTRDHHREEIVSAVLQTMDGTQHELVANREL